MTRIDSPKRDDVRKIVIAQLEMLGYTCRHPPKLGSGESNPAYEAFCNTYVEDLKDFSAEHLERGMIQFRRTWKPNPKKIFDWPKISELWPFFVEEQRQDREDARLRRLAIPDKRPDPPPPTEEEKARIAEKVRQLHADLAKVGGPPKRRAPSRGPYPNPFSSPAVPPSDSQKEEAAE